MAIILVIDNDSAVPETIRHILLNQHSVTGHAHVALAVDRIREVRPDAVFVDLGLDGADPRELISRLTEAPDMPPIVGMTRTPGPRLVVDAMRCGAFDVISKPIRVTDVQESLLRALSVRSRRSWAAGETESGISKHPPELADIVGVSPPIARLRSLILRIGPADAGVLITGESGVGKELVARAIHRVSDRAGQPFEVRNCGALPEQLFESEMFGTEAGAYTGAVRRAGAVELAHGGTLFLDEVGELTPANQIKLLRVLEQGVFHRVGGTVERNSDFRLVSATNKDLRAAVLAGEFRSDLYYRLNVLQINVAPLRDRAEDIPHLVSHFAGQEREDAKTSIFTSDALIRLANHSWPGNVRELRNVVQRCLCCAEKIPVRGSEIEFG